MHIDVYHTSRLVCLSANHSGYNIMAASKPQKMWYWYNSILSNVAIINSVPPCNTGILPNTNVYHNDMFTTCGYWSIVCVCVCLCLCLCLCVSVCFVYWLFILTEHTLFMSNGCVAHKLLVFSSYSIYSTPYMITA